MDALHGQALQLAFNQSFPSIIRDNSVDREAGKILIALDSQIGNRKSAQQISLHRKIPVQPGFRQKMHRHTWGKQSQAGTIEPDETCKQYSG